MINCIRTIIRTEGVSGLYKGLVPNLVGIVPEKAIKLGANDFFREMLADGNGQVSLRNGALAGALAGFFQCVATNPMEIVKIRMQVASLSGNPTTPMNIVSELGPRGLYKVARNIHAGSKNATVACPTDVARHRWFPPPTITC